MIINYNQYKSMIMIINTNTNKRQASNFAFFNPTYCTPYLRLNQQKQPNVWSRLPESRVPHVFPKVCFWEIGHWNIERNKKKLNKWSIFNKPSRFFHFLSSLQNSPLDLTFIKTQIMFGVNAQLEKLSTLPSTFLLRLILVLLETLQVCREQIR